MGSGSTKWVNKLGKNGSKIGWSAQFLARKQLWGKKKIFFCIRRFFLVVLSFLVSRLGSRQGTSLRGSASTFFQKTQIFLQASLTLTWLSPLTPERVPHPGERPFNCWRGRSLLPFWAHRLPLCEAANSDAPHPGNIFSWWKDTFHISQQVHPWPMTADQRVQRQATVFRGGVQVRGKRSTFFSTPGRHNNTKKQFLSHDRILNPEESGFFLTGNVRILIHKTKVQEKETGFLEGSFLGGGRFIGALPDNPPSTGG